jgi:Tfp pilus assembly protein PilX
MSPARASASISGRLKDESGIALVMALVALVVGLLLATTVTVAATGEGFLSGRDTGQKRSFEAAQAGLQQTVYDLNTLLNSAAAPQSVLEGQCIAGATVNGVNQEAVSNPTLNSAANGYLDCAPYTQSLGNGAFFTSWTSTVMGLDGQAPQACAGATVGVTALVTNRCIVSQGIVCPPSYSTPTCANPVTSRVEARFAAATGKPLFPVQGILAPNGSLVKNSAQIFGNLSTNLQVALSNTAQMNTPVVESSQPADPDYPMISNSALLGTGLACNSTNASQYTSTNTWPAACLTRFADPTTGLPGSIQLLDNPPPYAQYTDDSRITCAQANQTCPHDTFSTSSGACVVNTTGCATWDPTRRALTIPNGVTWLIGGGTYNFCSFTMSGGSSGTTAKLATGVKTEIFIDSPSNPSPSATPCQAGTGTITVGQGAAFVNLSPPLPGSTMPVDTTALFIDVYGKISPISDTAATYSSNSCNLNGNTTDASCVQLGQSSNFYGTVYAPESDVKITNTGATYGGIAGRTVTFDNPGSFTQDVNVTKLITTPTQALYFRTAWIQCGASATSTNPMFGC